MSEASSLKPQACLCDIAIIGGGPAGLAAAISARKTADVRVVLFERKQHWGAPVQCAGYAPRLLGRILPFDRSAIRSSVDGLRLFHGDTLIGDVKSPGYILHRDRLETQAADAAKEAGVVCHQPARVLEIGDGEIVFEDAESVKRISCHVIIGADGPRSMVRREMKIPDQPLAMGLEYELELCEPLNAAEIHFAPEYGAGYAWIFPHADGTAGAGLALDPNEYNELRPRLLAFVDRMAATGRIKADSPRRIIAGPVPIGGPVEHTVEGRMMLVGDAAGQTNPLTGAGIYTAAVCGQIAGRIAAEAIKNEDLDLLQNYESEWRDLLDLMLIRALRGREKMIEMRNETTAHFDVALEAWSLRRFRKK